MRQDKYDDSFRRFFEAYLVCALWSSTDGDDPLDKKYTVEDIAPETKAKMEADCKAFFKKNNRLFKGMNANAGHDFWLTRNGHGAGFWDGSWEKHGEKLIKESKAFGECDLYVSDGKIYI